jgi:hypothetical protein
VLVAALLLLTVELGFTLVDSVVGVAAGLELDGAAEPDPAAQVKGVGPGIV